MPFEAVCVEAMKQGPPDKLWSKLLIYSLVAFQERAYIIPTEFPYPKWPNAPHNWGHMPYSIKT